MKKILLSGLLACFAYDGCNADTGGEPESEESEAIIASKTPDLIVRDTANKALGVEYRKNTTAPSNTTAQIFDDTQDTADEALEPGQKGKTTAASKTSTQKFDDMQKAAAAKREVSKRVATERSERIADTHKMQAVLERKEQELKHEPPAEPTPSTKRSAADRGVMVTRHVSHLAVEVFVAKCLGKIATEVTEMKGWEDNLEEGRSGAPQLFQVTADGKKYVVRTVAGPRGGTAMERSATGAPDLACLFDNKRVWHIRRTQRKMEDRHLDITLALPLNFAAYNLSTKEIRLVNLVDDSTRDREDSEGRVGREILPKEYGIKADEVQMCLTPEVEGMTSLYKLQDDYYEIIHPGIKNLRNRLPVDNAIKIALKKYYDIGYTLGKQMAILHKLGRETTDLGDGAPTIPLPLETDRQVKEQERVMPTNSGGASTTLPGKSTTIHGDAFPHNIFVSVDVNKAATGRVALIDLDRFGGVYGSKYSIDYDLNSTLKNRYRVHNIPFTVGFLTGYINAFPKIIDCFGTGNTSSIDESVFNDHLSSLYEYFVYNIFFRNQGEDELLDVGNAEASSRDADKVLFDELRHAMGLHTERINFEIFARVMATIRSYKDWSITASGVRQALRDILARH